MAEMTISERAPAPRHAAGPAALLLPVGHCIGVDHRLGDPAAPRQVRRGAVFHDLNEDQFAIWVAAHGAQEAIESDVTWQRESVKADPRLTGLARADELIDQLLVIGLLVEVTPGTHQALDFARSHRLVPLMPGLGNSSDQPDTFGIGVLHQPVVEVSYDLYDLWQWSTMNDSLWATCENAADVGQRAGAISPALIDPATMLTRFLPSLHALLLSNAAYLDTYFRLNWPKPSPVTSAGEPSTEGSMPVTDMSGDGGPLIFPMGHYLGASYPAAGAAADFHVVRIGWDTYELRGDDQIALWALAHGVPFAGGADLGPWTRSAVEAVALVGGTGNVAGAMADLLDQDLLIEVMPGTQKAIDFARACRTRSLLIGLGNTPDDPLSYGISGSEWAPRVEVDGFTFELWKWGHACDSVWHACHVMAAAGDPADPDEVDPERVLNRCLRSIQVLVAGGAVYLDQAREEF